MKLGFLAFCLSQEKLEDVVKWARKVGFEALEVEFDSHIDLDLDKKRAEEIRSLFKRYDVEFSSLGYYPNCLDPDEKKRLGSCESLKKAIRGAQILEVSRLNTFVGMDPGKSVEENLVLFERIFPELVDFAEEHKVKLMIENYPIMNIAYSPQIWKRMFEIIPSKNFGLNFDPSHLHWLGIDYIKPIREFKERIFGVHAKDTEILKEKLDQVGIQGEGWWRYRIPGFGEINWSRLVSTLNEIRYDGAVIIEQEDPLWSESSDSIKKGLMLGKRHLIQLII